MPGSTRRHVQVFERSGGECGCSDGDGDWSEFSESVQSADGYWLLVGGEANLRVYDLLGREVAVLVNEMKQPGRYSVSFDASGLSSGTYIYRLDVGESRMTKRMTLLR